MKTLIIDIGNSRLKWALIDSSGEFISLGHWDHRANIEIELKKQWELLLPPDAVLIASVAGGTILSQIERWIEIEWKHTPSYFHSTAEAYGVSNAYIEPKNLGVDRWATLIAAHILYKSNTLIVNCGTALTIDVLSITGEHQGGYILPGLDMMRRALEQGTYALPYASGDVIDLADNTQDAIGNGTILSIVAVIEKVNAMLVNKWQTNMLCVITGGNAELIKPLLSFDVTYEPQLVLKGLAQAAIKES